MVFKQLRKYSILRNGPIDGPKKVEFPEHILFSRDGVSESQYSMVKDKELPQIETACKQFGASNGKPNWKPLITLIVVGKRHHARFYPDPDSEHNLRAASCMDSTVVAPDQFNFYLQSHDSPLGTARTDHYVVITNRSGYSAKELQDLVRL
jgi:hypothetical protein